MTLGAEGKPTDEIVGDSTDLNAPPNFGIVVFVTGAESIRIEDLKIRGGVRWGMGVTGFGVGQGVRISNCRFEDNDFWGLVVFRGRGNATAPDFSSNGSLNSSGEF